jgi:hypothetical protein
MKTATLKPALTLLSSEPVSVPSVSSVPSFAAHAPLAVSLESAVRTGAAGASAVSGDTASRRGEPETGLASRAPDRSQLR